MKPPYAIGSVPVCRVTQLRTDSVHCRESAGTGSVNLNVAPNECCYGRYEPSCIAKTKQKSENRIQ